MPLWHKAGPRASLIYDLRGDGKTALRAGFFSTNSNAVYNVRSTTGRQNVTDFTTGQTVQIAQFNSPIAVLGPRIIRFNVTYKFGR